MLLNETVPQWVIDITVDVSTSPDFTSTPMETFITDVLKNPCYFSTLICYLSFASEKYAQVQQNPILPPATLFLRRQNAKKVSDNSSN